MLPEEEQSMAENETPIKAEVPPAQTAEIVKPEPAAPPAGIASPVEVVKAEESPAKPKAEEPYGQASDGAKTEKARSNAEISLSPEEYGAQLQELAAHARSLGLQMVRSYAKRGAGILDSLLAGLEEGRPEKPPPAEPPKKD
jgi:hypothetical protein